MTYQFDMFDLGSASQCGERQTDLEELIEESKRHTKVLIGCETSGIVREAFLAEGYDTWSCDILPADTQTNRHIQDDIRNVLKMERWDLVFIGHPPCTRLCNSGVRWLHKAPPNKTPEQMWQELDEGCELFSDLWNADVPCLAIENPVMHKYAKERIRNYKKFSQSVQPWEFATDPESEDNSKKRTCFWTRNLPPLVKTGTLDGSTARADVHNAAPSADRWKIRSKFYPALAAAMADQWGRYASINRRAAA
jgi:hypothetical protein